MTKKKNDFFKVLFAITFLGFLTTLGLYLYTFNSEKSPTSNEEEVKQQISETKSENELLLALQKLDNFLIAQSKLRATLQDYDSLYNQVEDKDLKNLIALRIEKTQQLLAAEKDDEISAINLRNQLAIQRKNVDSVTVLLDSLKQLSEENKEVQNTTVDSLQQIITKQQSQLLRQEAKQVISFTNANGNLIHYLGEVVNGKANGGGIGIWNTGSIYKGQWKNNQRHGTGQFKWADGQLYEGEFENDLRTGEGTYTWPSGEKYVGEFKDNKMNGKGTLYDPDGNKKFEGVWKNDKPKE